MAYVETQVTLAEVTTAIVTALAGELSESVETVTAYADTREKPALPAVLLELAEFTEGEDLGTGQTPLRCRWEAFVLVDGFDASAQSNVRDLAAAVAHIVRRARFGVPIEPIRLLGAYPDEFDRFDLDDVAVWRVEFEGDILIGVNEFAPDPDATTPDTIVGEWDGDEVVIVEPDE